MPEAEAKALAGFVAAVAASPAYTVAKPSQVRVRLLAGLGVEGDAHMGASVQHRSRLGREAAMPNLRQVHLIHGELPDGLRAVGFDLVAGQMAENITTRGLDRLALPAGTRLRIGIEAGPGDYWPPQPL